MSRIPKRPKYRIAEYQRAPLALDEKTAWKCWCEYKHSSKRVKDILRDYDISIPTLYKSGERYGDNFRRGRGTRTDWPISLTKLESMWRDYAAGDLTLPKLEQKYGVGMPWLYKYANEFKGGRRRRPDRVPRNSKKALSARDEQAAWRDYERGKLTVDEIIEKYAINKSTLYDIGDRLGSTFRRQKPAAKQVKQRARYLRNMLGVDEE